MYFRIEKASDGNYSDTREFNTLDELLSFIEEQKFPRSEDELCGVIMQKEDDGWEIKIYDDYVE